ncbi:MULTISPECIES: LuxR C-terminal-related transcriptional regulator [unclassified Mycobacterium]|uniref:LuxR C-terminal-related transcriptional regulator n=1 Tax=unclassified Mycobacterium TaxID=2642494 RepID=UPI0029C8E784|nr:MULTISPECIES: LuxR C-terminal-related transcriptional regulator [unclassified Mycobacterium]
MSATDWGELGVTGSTGLPTGTVTLLLADVEGSTRLWEAQPDEMRTAVARLDRTLVEVVARHHGVRPVEQGEGDSFVIAFTRVSDAVSCALALQVAPLAPLRLRIGIHVGELHLRDEGNYVGPTINRTARLRDLAHGGQSVLTGAAAELVMDTLPEGAWLTELGTHAMRDVARPERVLQLCHPDLNNDFPPLRAMKTAVTEHLPVQLTRFVGRATESREVAAAVADKRLITLTGAGGVGKTRLAVEVAGRVAADFGNGARYVDLAPIVDPDLVAKTTARAVGLPDQPGRSTIDALTRFLADRDMLVVLDNCEHLLDAVATMVTALLGAASRVTVLTTSREPIGVPGESIWRVPSLSLNDEAVELFVDRARLAKADFALTDENHVVVTEICRRLDGMPLAIELAAARVRSMAPAGILAGLQDRFRLLTGGARTAVRRQQTLRASVDWSHALLTAPERVLFRRLAAFVGGFDAEAAAAVGAGGDVQGHQILDLLSLLVDKSLIVAELGPVGSRYRMLETVRQYGLEKLGESGEADEVRVRHRDHYVATAMVLDTPSGTSYTAGIDAAERELDNLRAAYDWCRESGDLELALTLTSALLPLWLTRGRILEGRQRFAALMESEAFDELSLTVRARTYADKAVLDAWGVTSYDIDEAQRAVAIARELDDAALLGRALAACGSIASYDAAIAEPFFAEAVELVRGLDDRWRLSQILGWQAYAAFIAGDPVTAHRTGVEGAALAEAIGDGFVARFCRNWGVGAAMVMRGELHAHSAMCQGDGAAAILDNDQLNAYIALLQQSNSFAHQGDCRAARSAALAAIEAGEGLSPALEGTGYAMLAQVELADGNAEPAEDAITRAWPYVSIQGQVGAIFSWFRAEAKLASGDYPGALQSANDGTVDTRGWHRMMSLVSRARVLTTAGETEPAERDVYEALSIATVLGVRLGVPDALECLGRCAASAASHREAVRLCSAAAEIRAATGAVRFKVHDRDVEDVIASLQEALGEQAFAEGWAEGAALSVDEAIAYAQRGRGERKRPSSGWGSLTPTELDVVRLVGEGLGNKDIGVRLFVSPRTVQTHLTHVYAKLGVTSRVQLAQEAVRRAQDAL